MITGQERIGLPINRRRHLAAAFLGEGQDGFGMRDVREHLIDSCEQSANQLRWLAGRAVRVNGSTRYLRHFDDKALGDLNDALEKYRTAQLELAFLFGRNDVIQEILKDSGVARTTEGNK